MTCDPLDLGIALLKGVPSESYFNEIKIPATKQIISMSSVHFVSHGNFIHEAFVFGR